MSRRLTVFTVVSVAQTKKAIPVPKAERILIGSSIGQKLGELVSFWVTQSWSERSEQRRLGISG